MRFSKKAPSSFLVSALVINALPTGEGASQNTLLESVNWSVLFTNFVSSAFTGSAWWMFDGIRYLLGFAYSSFLDLYDIFCFSGFFKPLEIVGNLLKICCNKFDIVVYGQEKQKKQIFDGLCGVIARIDSILRNVADEKDVRGNVVYIIGPSGTGKSKMCYAIAKAFLKCPEKTCIFCHSESITGESDLASQLFKTTFVKDIGARRQKDKWQTGAGEVGLVPKDVESPMLKHSLKWPESVVIIDEYDKMKKLSAKGSAAGGSGMMAAMMRGMGGGLPAAGLSGAGGDSVDNSADEILRSIVSTGKYVFMGKEIDFRKRLILITSNETREEIEKNFGVDGRKGGGSQRLIIIEFEKLTRVACEGIVNDLVKSVSSRLKDKNGPFGLRSVSFDKKSLDLMAEFIFKDDVMQGRAKYKLEDKIYGLMSKTMGKDRGKDVKLEFFFNEGTGDFGFKRV